MPDRLPLNVKSPALWLALAFLVVHGLVVYLLPDRLSWCDTLCIILAELAASFSCLRAAQQARNEGRTLWRLLAGSILFIPVAAGLFMRSELMQAADSNPAPGIIILLNTFYGAAVLLSVSMVFDPRISRPFRIIGACLSVAIGALFFVLVFSVIPLQGSSRPEDLLFIVHLFDAIDVFLASVATIRLLGADRAEERDFFYVACLFLWANAIIPAIRNRLLITNTFDGVDLLIPPPYLLLAVLAWHAPRRSNQDWRPSSRAMALVRSAGTIFLSLGLLFLGIAVSRRHFWVGAAAILLSVVCYGILNLITLSRSIKAEEALSDAKLKLEELAGLDGLTGIANRRTFAGKIDIEFRAARRSRQPISLLMIDVDLFKQLNDSQGHLVGDSYLVQIAQALRRSVPRATDLVARYGGEEFVILLPLTNTAGAAAVADRLHAAITNLGLEHPVSLSGKLTVSIGAATADESATGSPSALILAADRALYRAKTRGRNRTECSAVEDEIVSENRGPGP